jgi:hypothetical protein
MTSAATKNTGRDNFVVRKTLEYLASFLTNIGLLRKGADDSKEGSAAVLVIQRLF